MHHKFTKTKYSYKQVIYITLTAFMLGITVGYIAGIATNVSRKLAKPAKQGSQITIPAPAEPTPPGVNEAYSLAGTVKAVSDGRIIISASFPGVEFSERELILTEDTNITINRPMTDEERKIEVEELVKQQEVLEKELSATRAGAEYLTLKKRIAEEQEVLGDLERQASDFKFEPLIREILQKMEQLKREENMLYGNWYVTVDGAISDLQPGTPLTIDSGINIAEAKEIMPTNITINIPATLQENYNPRPPMTAPLTP